MGSFRRLHRSDEPKPNTEDLRDHTYLNWIRSLPCAHCHAVGPSHPHHSTAAPVTCELCTGKPPGRPERRGKKQKCHDHYAFPLCFKCHRTFHDMEGDFKGGNRAQRRAWQEALSLEYHKRYFDTESF